MRDIKLKDIKVGMDTQLGFVVGVYGDVFDVVSSVDEFRDYINDDYDYEMDIDQYALEGFEDTTVRVYGMVSNF